MDMADVLLKEGEISPEQDFDAQTIVVQSMRQLPTALQCAKGYRGETNIKVLGTQFECTIYGCLWSVSNNRYMIHYNKYMRNLIAGAKKLCKKQ